MNICSKAPFWKGFSELKISCEIDNHYSLDELTEDQNKKTCLHAKNVLLRYSKEAYASVLD